MGKLSARLNSWNSQLHLRGTCWPARQGSGRMLAALTLIAFTCFPSTLHAAGGASRVFTLGENLDVDPGSGTSALTIPIEVPPGRGGIQPNVTLLYNSSAGNGILGVGWHMELGSIQRSTKKGVPAYNNLTDTFVLTQAGSQQELVDVSGSASEFKPEVEGSFMKIRFDGTSWTATDKKGVKYYFGSSSASRVIDPAHTSHVYRWCLDKVEDIFGNMMTVTYTPDDNQLYPIQIDYGANSGGGLTAYGQVKFNYESRTNVSDYARGYLSGFKIELLRRVKSIEVLGGGNLLRKYVMTYVPETETGRSLLQGVTLVGADGNSLPSTVMTYSQIATNLSSPATISNAPGYNLGGDKLQRLMDMNGDGKVDIVNTSSSYQIYYNQSSGGNVSFSSPVWAENPPTVNFANDSVRLADLNGDGLQDVIYGLGGSAYQIWLNNGVDGFLPGGPVSNYPSVGFNDQNKVHMVDMNGDGNADILETGDGIYKIYFNVGGSNFNPGIVAVNSPPKGTSQAGVQFGDFNGDGLSDVVVGDLPNYRIWMNNGVNGFSSPVTTSQNPSVALGDPYVQIADMNGDGLTDVVQSFSGSSAYYLYYNNGKTDFNAFVVAPTSPSYGTGNPNVKFMDLNDDRQLDVVVGDPGNSIPYQVWLSDGYSGFKSALNLGNGPSVNLDNENVVFADINADGRMDVLRGAVGNWQVWLNTQDSRCSRPGTMIDMDNSLGGHLEVTYQHVWVKGIGGTGYKVAVSPYLFNAVKTISKRTSLTGESYVTTYALKDGLWDSKEREFRGFKTVKVIDAEGNYAVSEYAQDDIYKGRPLSQSVYDSLNRLFSKSVSTWDKEELNPANGSKPAVNFIFLKQADSYIYDGDATGKRTQQQFYYGESPQLGNLTKTVSLGEVNLTTGADVGTDSVTVEVSYVNNTSGTNWLIGLPKTTLAKNHSDTIVGQSWFYYDGATDANATPIKGTLTQKEDWAGAGGTNPKTKYSYDSVTGNLLTTTDPKGNVTTITYDPTYKLFPLKTKNALTHEVVNEYYGVNGVALNSGGFYGLWGQMKSTTDPNNQKGQRVYDAFGRVVKMISPVDSITYPTTSYEYIYAASSLKVITKQRQYNGQAGTIDSVVFYDGLGRGVQSKAKAEGGLFIVSGQTQYNSRGLPIKKYVSYVTNEPLTDMDTLDITKPAVSLSYDGMGRVVQTTNPDGSTASVSYNDWVTISINENGHKQESESDAYGRLIKKREYTGSDGRSSAYPASASTLYATTEYTYDAKGNLTQTKDAKGNITTISYDALGRKISMTDPDMGTWQYGYDLNGNLLSQTDAKGQKIDFTYDQINRLKKKADNPLTGTMTVDYTYDDVSASNTKGRLTKAAYSGGRTSFSYDTIGREIQSVKTIGQTGYSVGRSYDALDRLVTLQYPDATKVGYSYNEMGQVDSAYEVLPTTVMPGSGSPDVTYLPSPYTHYVLNESGATTVNDTGLGHYNGAASADISSLSTTGKLDKAFRFNGVNQFVNIDGQLAAIKTDTKGTFAFWVKPESGATFLSFGGSGGIVTMEWYEANQSATFAVSGAGTPVSCTTGANSLPLGAWSHVAFVQDGVGLKIYINGVEQTLSYWFESNKGAWFSYITGPFSYGRMGAFTSNGTNSSFYRGAIDDVRYYSNKALSAGEVWAIYNDGVGTEAENPAIDNTSPPPVSSVPHVSSPYAQFRLNDNAAGTTVWDDAIGMNDGVANVNTNTLTTTGKINSALNFNGTSQYAAMDSLLTDIKADTVGTFTMWVKPAGTTSGRWLSFSSSGGSLSMEWYGSNQSVTFATSNLSCYTPGGTIPSGSWSHVAFVQDGISLKIYVNGVQQSLTYWSQVNKGAWFSSLPSSWTNGNGRMAVYKDPGSGISTEYFKGMMDDVRHYKKALSADEVNAIYANGSGTEDPNPAMGSEAPPAAPPSSSTVPPTAGRVYIANVDYNAQGQMTKLEYGNGVVTTYTYDAVMSRLTKIRTVTANSIVIQDLSYTYDGAGNILTITDAVNSATQGFQYDAINRLTQAVGSAYGTKTYTYDTIGNILTKDGLTYTYGTKPHAVTGLSDGTTITYDTNGNMITKSKSGVVMSYTYNKENRLTQVKKNTSVIAKFEYDGDGGRTKKLSYVTVTTAPQDTCFLKGTKVTMADGTTKPIEDIKEGDEVLSFDTRTGGKVTARVAKTFQHVTSENYRLINGHLGVTEKHLFYTEGQWKEAWELKPGDKLLNADLTETEVTSMESISPKMFSATSNTVEVYNLTVEGTHNYFADNHLVHNKQTFGPLLTTIGTPTQSSVTTTYVGELYETASNTNTATKSVFLGSRRVAAIDKITNDPIFYHEDHLGGVNVTTDKNGTLLELLEYDPYGKMTRHDGLTTNQKWAKHQFTGKKLDDETGLYYFGARYYDPSLGRFITPDTIVQSPGNPQTLNRYTYCNNNPINNIDPTGHSWWKKAKKWFKAIGIAIAGTVLAIVSAGTLTPLIGAYWAGVMTGGIVGATVGGTFAAATGGNIGMGLLTGFVGGAVFAGLAPGLSNFSDGVFRGIALNGAAGPLTQGASMASNALAGFLGGSASGAAAAGISGGDVGQAALLGGGIAAGISIGRDTSLWMRSKMIQQSRLDSRNSSGQSVGFNNDGFKLGGGRFDPTHPNGNPSPLGGHQGGVGQIFGMSYKSGSFWDQLVEAYAGPHDFLNSWGYDRFGNLQNQVGFERFLGATLNPLNVVVATPIVATSVVPSQYYPTPGIIYGQPKPKR